MEEILYRPAPKPKDAGNNLDSLKYWRVPGDSGLSFRGADFGVVTLVAGNDQIGAETALGGVPCGGGYPAKKGTVAKQFDYARGLAVDVTHRFHKAIDTLSDEVGNAAAASGNGRDTTGHGFQRGEAEGFRFAGQMEDMHAGDKALHVVLLTEKPYVLVKVQFMSEPFGGAALRAIAGKKQFSVYLLANLGKDVDAIENALHGAEVGNVEDAFATGGRGHGRVEAAPLGVGIGLIE